MTEDKNNQTFNAEKELRRKAYNRLNALQIAGKQLDGVHATTIKGIALDTIRLAEQYRAYLEFGVIPKVKA